MKLTKPLTLTELSKSEYTELYSLFANKDFYFNPIVLTCFCDDWIAAKILKGDKELIAICVLPINDQKVQMNLFQIYSGILFADLATFSKVNKFNTTFGALELFSNWLSKFDNFVEIDLLPSITDVRPFLWEGYHSEAGPKFSVNVRYTSILKISDGTDKFNREYLASNLSKVRRYSLKEAEKYGAELEEPLCVDGLVNKYIETMRLQKQPVSSETQLKIYDTMQFLLDKKLCGLFRVKSNDGAVLSEALYSLGQTAVYLFGSTNPEKKTTWDGTFLHFKSWEKLVTSGSQYINLEGINSPSRGWFKMSFGGDIIPYYQVKKS